MASEKKPAAGGHHDLSFVDNLIAGGLAGVGTSLHGSFLLGEGLASLESSPNRPYMVAMARKGTKNSAKGTLSRSLRSGAQMALWPSCCSCTDKLS